MKRRWPDLASWPVDRLLARRAERQAWVDESSQECVELATRFLADLTTAPERIPIPELKRYARKLEALRSWVREVGAYDVLIAESEGAAGIRTVQGGTEQTIHDDLAQVIDLEQRRASRPPRGTP